MAEPRILQEIAPVWPQGEVLMGSTGLTAECQRLLKTTERVPFDAPVGPLKDKLP